MSRPWIWSPHIRPRIKFWLGFLLSVVCLLIFVDISNDWTDANWEQLEWRFAEPILAWRSEQTEVLIRGISGLGSFLVLFPLVSTLVLWPASPLLRVEKLALLWLSLLATALNSWMKDWFGRPRPGPEYSPLVAEPYMSFPSGHSMMSLVIYGFLAYLLWRRRCYRTAAMLWLLILAIGVTRIYLAAHYPGDVLGGFCAGTPCLWLTLTALQWQRGDLSFSNASSSRPECPGQ